MNSKIDQKVEHPEEINQPFYTLDISNSVSYSKSGYTVTKELDTMPKSNIDSKVTENTKTPKEENLTTHANSEDINLSNMEFLIRIGFLRKVYGALVAQMFATMAFTCLCFFDSYVSWYIQNSWIVIVGIILILITFILHFCKASRKVPFNYLLLAILTIGTSMILSYICARYNKFTVLTAWGFAICMVLSLTAYSFIAKIEFNSICAIGYIVLCSMFLMSVFGAIVQYKLLIIFYCMLGAMLYGLFLVCYTKLIIGEYAIKYDLDDYIMASISLYFVIIFIFVYTISAISGAALGHNQV